MFGCKSKCGCKCALAFITRFLHWFSHSRWRSGCSLSATYSPREHEQCIKLHRKRANKSPIPAHKNTYFIVRCYEHYQSSAQKIFDFLLQKAFLLDKSLLMDDPLFIQVDIFLQADYLLHQKDSSKYHAPVSRLFLHQDLLLNLLQLPKDHLTVYPSD